MPPRRKPTSTRQKKADVRLRRAIKRGDLPVPKPKKNTHKPRTGRRGPTGNLIGSTAGSATSAIDVQATRRLQSTFLTPPQEFLEEAKSLASKLTLCRPISDEVSVFDDIHFHHIAGSDNVELSCPRRPKWRFDMTKKEVERNEEAMFNKWLEQIDGAVQVWQSHNATSTEYPKNSKSLQETNIPEEVRTMPRSPTYFERNIEVWRQLWRVTEISQILLVLLDSRCPLLHFPPSLYRYLSGRNVILVLTKVDIAGTSRADAWSDYLRKRYPSFRVVQVESYAKNDSGRVPQGSKELGPLLSKTFGENLVDAIRLVYNEISQPPDEVKSDPIRLQKWKPVVKQNINWDRTLGATSYNGVAPPDRKEVDDEQFVENHKDKEPKLLTIGLIGQPNVGKSSLLNALFGANRVHASKTPGKTKHFQTLYWTSDIRLVDCPGLVMPNFVPMELQVLSGIIPISRVSAVPSCVYYASQLLPIEQILGISHPGLLLPPVEDRRTWRDRVEPRRAKNILTWTTMDVLISYANSKGWVTAKAGRPDIHRAGNAILRALAEGRIGWAFWPPGTDPERITATRGEEGVGIWTPRTSVIDKESEDESEEDGYMTEAEKGEGDSESEDEGEDSEDANVEAEGKGGHAFISGRFQALVIDDVANEDDD